MTELSLPASFDFFSEFLLLMKSEVLSKHCEPFSLAN